MSPQHCNHTPWLSPQNTTAQSFDALPAHSVPDRVRLLANDPLGSQRERYQHPLPQSYYDAFNEISHDQHNELVVVEANGEVIGTLQLTFIPYRTFQGGKRAQIEAVRVDQRYRSAGIGNKLLAWAIARARQSGCHLVQLTTNASRPDALRFYLRLGFVASHVGMKLDLTQHAIDTAETAGT